MTDTDHRDDCQAEFVDGAMAWTDCECRNKTHADRLAEIRARAEAATPGPWAYEPGEALHGPDPDADRIHYVSTVADIADDDPPMTSFYDEADARFTAEARADVPFLLGQLEQARAERDDTRSDCRELERSEKFLEGEYNKARDRGNRLAYVIDRAKQVEERPTDPGSTHDETWMYRNEGFNEARRWFLMLLSDKDSSSGEAPDGD